MKTDFKGILIILVLAFIIGLLVARGFSHPPTQGDLKIQELRLEGAKTTHKVNLAFRVAMVTILVLATAGAACQGVKWLAKKVNTIYPNQAGIFPIIKVKIGKVLALHDPNRAPTPTTIYTQGDIETVQVLHLIPKGLSPDQQLQITSQAQVAQTVAAATRQGTSAQGRRLVEAVLLTRPKPKSALPEVKVLEVEPSHIEKLLEEEEELD